MAKNNNQVTEISKHDEGSGAMFKPADMRVLAIDANVVCLKYLVAILQKCQYRVTSTTLAAEALKILRENKNDYHVVITDVKRLDMDGFKLLEIIGLEMDLPVIMVSAEDSRSSIMKGIRHGARDYLLKPVRIQEMQNIWQHVLRKRLSDSSDKSSSFIEEMIEQESVPSIEPEEEVTRAKEKEIIGSANGDTCSVKKPRVTWSSELHVKFVDCVKKLEASGERVQPKRIREMMNVEGLSRENIASHLQVS
ncbi:TWO-COMPONENT RESPONSE REGULATOR [Salix viminalis]|uniref:TWO-COMPONENT RESPONSE REGULATOR n=1 Tax=Salix viminalis TaxID=40686 RepID=A0A9Q0NPG7_SALVM|nr:TWO-COMPONENT RESPONSE REGULATOR [Salix viminalis]